MCINETCAAPATHRKVEHEHVQSAQDGGLQVVHLGRTLWGGLAHTVQQPHLPDAATRTVENPQPPTKDGLFVELAPKPASPVAQKFCGTFDCEMCVGVRYSKSTQ